MTNPKPFFPLLLLYRRLFYSSSSSSRLSVKTLTPTAVAAAIRSKPAAAASIFRHAATHRGYRHTSLVYHTIILISISRQRFSLAESLVDEVIAGACPDADLPLFNTIVSFFCQRKHLFSAFDVLNRMRQLKCSPSVETYASILEAIVRQLDKSSTRYVYLRSVGSLVRQMIHIDGLVPDVNVMSLVIVSYCKCQELDHALKVFDEMVACNFHPNETVYGSLVVGLCAVGRIAEARGFYQRMRTKDLVPTAGVYMMVVNTLSIEREYDDGIAVLFDMLGNGKTPDLLTYRTLLEGLCREGRKCEAFQLLDRLKKTKMGMNQRAHSHLLRGLHWLCQSSSKGHKDKMAKKPKKMGSFDLSPSSSFPPELQDEDDIGLNTQILMDDCVDLVKGIRDKSMRLRTAKKKKHHLTTEVKFLRRRYEYFIKTQPEKFGMPNPKSQTTIARSSIKLMKQSIVAHPNTNTNLNTRFPLKKKKKMKKKKSCGNLNHQTMTTMLIEDKDEENTAANLKSVVSRDDGNQTTADKNNRKRKITWREPVAVWVV